MLERRTHTRLGAFIPCQIHSGQEKRPGRLLDVSLGGASVSSGYVPKQGESLTISVELGDSQKTISLYGSVLRVTRYIADHRGEVCRFAMRFSAVTPESMMLVRYVMGKSHRTS